MELYTVQEEGRAFETPQALFESVGLWPLTQVIIGWNLRSAVHA